MGIYATPAGFQRAEAEAQQLGVLLALDKFDWGIYLKKEVTQNTSLTCADWIALEAARAKEVEVQLAVEKKTARWQQFLLIAVCIGLFISIGLGACIFLLYHQVLNSERLHDQPTYSWEFGNVNGKHGNPNRTLLLDCQFKPLPGIS